MVTPQNSISWKYVFFSFILFLYIFLFGILAANFRGFVVSTVLADDNWNDSSRTGMFGVFEQICFLCELQSHVRFPKCKFSQWTCRIRFASDLNRLGSVGQNWVQWVLHSGLLLDTLLTLLSSTFLQTLPDLVMPLKGHSLSPHSCPVMWSVPSERFGYWKDCGSSLAPKHAFKHEAHPPRLKKKKRVLSWFKRFWFYLSWCKQHGQL